MILYEGRQVQVHSSHLNRRKHLSQVNSQQQGRCQTSYVNARKQIAKPEAFDVYSTGEGVPSPTGVTNQIKQWQFKEVTSSIGGD